MTSSIHVAGLTWSRMGMVLGIACMQKNVIFCHT